MNERTPQIKELYLSSSSLAGLLNGALSKNAAFRFQARGFSMSPFIKDGDILTVSPLSVSGAGIGKVAAFIQPKDNKLVIHRIVGKANGSYIIKADNGFTGDGLIPAGNILGCVTKIERKGRDILLGLGPERYLLAVISRSRLLIFAVRAYRFIKRTFQAVSRI